MEETLDSGAWTVFAPTNKAFEEELGEELGLFLTDQRGLVEMLLFHAVEEVLSKDNLNCGNLIEMANGETTKTVCSRHRLDPFGKAQKGPGNPDHDLPVIVIKDVEACNGIAHVVDEVILPGGH